MPARLNTGRCWTDATIHNLSRTGMMLRPETPLNSGDFLEVRRGKHVIIARIVWSDGEHCGAKLQDPVCVADVIADRPTARRLTRPLERRHVARRDSRPSDHGRLVSRAIDFGFCLLLAIAGAGVLTLTAYESLATSMHDVTAALEK